MVFVAKSQKHIIFDSFNLAVQQACKKKHDLSASCMSDFLCEYMNSHAIFAGHQNSLLSQGLPQCK